MPRHTRNPHRKIQRKGLPKTRLPLGFPFGQNENPQAEIATAFASGESEVTVVFRDGGYSRISSKANSVTSGMIAFAPPLKESESVVGPYAATASGGKAYF